MPGRTPAEAATAFLEPLQQAVSCVAHGKITPSPGGRAEAGREHAWSLNRDEGVRLSGGQRLRARMRYEIINDPGRGPEDGPWRVTTRGYMYSVDSADGQEMIAAHWHPASPGPHKQPHLHVPVDMVSEAGYFLAREPLYTGRITFEFVIRFAVKNLGAEPMCEDWESKLLLAETPHKLYRSWHETPEEAAPPAQ